MNFLRNAKGFTLVEILLVLLLVSAMSGLSLLSLQSLQQAQKEKITISQITDQLYYCQQLAISFAERTTCLIDNNNKKILIRQLGKTIHEYPFDVAANFERGSLGLHEVEYNANGNVRKSGTILVTINKTSYRIVFWIGRGRFDVQAI